MYTKEYYPTIKVNEIISFSATWTDLKYNAKFNKPNRKNRYHIYLYVASKNGCKWTYIYKRKRLSDIANRPKGIVRVGERYISSLGLTYTHYYI